MILSIVLINSLDEIPSAPQLVFGLSFLAILISSCGVTGSRKIEFAL